MSNGVMPCVLGPTSFNLKFWANILISDEHQNVVVFMMIFIWVHHIHADVLFWTFYSCQVYLHVLHVLDESGLLMNNLLNYHQNVLINILN
ncbi:hypothetical protein MTR_5g045320 [Medicago truncatula]|uniref:Uncharacterized protein n=1 Tax=Medicago truncatula TaxID=3880 RepID=G7JZ20_MEDTR|nr:hypothetical protein MTR_5g045320 [Medicago truncatula]